MFQPVLINLLDYHFKNTNFNQKTTFVRHGHVAALFVLFSKIIERQYALIIPFLPLIVEQCLPKWASQFESLTNYPVSWVIAILYVF